MVATSFDLQLSQQITITPQLQQAIKLLQLSSLELRAEILNSIEKNPLLELPDEELSDDPVNIDNNHISADLATKNRLNTIPNKNIDYEDISDKPLIDHLLWQLNLSRLTKLDKRIAIAIIENIDEKGYLQISLLDIYQELTKELSDIEYDDVKTVAKTINGFDPIGVGATTLKECLLVQLNITHHEHPIYNIAVKIIKDHLNGLACQETLKIAKKLKRSIDDIESASKLIKSLNPTPGIKFAKANQAYIIPDIIVKFNGKKWIPYLNKSHLPKLLINTSYANLIKQRDTSSENNYLKEHLQEAKWLISSIEARFNTLLKVATELVNYQQSFFEQGDIAIKPLVLQKVAEKIDMHESTISRVTTGKYMETPFGTYSLKHFFSSQLSTVKGSSCSAASIKAIIKNIVGSESRLKPLSDNKISTLLKKQGYKVARRTVAKYREALGILASNERKLLV